MARGGSTAAEKHKRVRARLTQEDKTLRHNKRVELNNSIQEATFELHEKVESISSKHKKNITWASRALYLGGKMMKKKRSATAWNAFVSQELKLVNEELPPGSRYKLTKFMTEHHTRLLERWAKVTPKQREELAAGLVLVRANRATTHRATGKSIQKDVNATFESMDLEWDGVCERTGVEGFYMAVRGDIEHFQQPRQYFSEKARDFFTNGLGLDPDRVILQLEAWVVAGLKQGPVRAKRTVSQEISECRNLVQQGLDTILIENGRDTSLAMNYDNYERKIVIDLGVILTGWPSSQVTNPGKLGARSRVTALLHALNTKACKWTKLTEEELEARIKSNDDREANGEVVYKLRKAKVADTTN